MKKSGKVKYVDSTATGGWNMFKEALEHLYYQNFHINECEEICSDIELVDLETHLRIHLKTLCQANVPLILNFGSCT